MEGEGRKEEEGRKVMGGRRKSKGEGSKVKEIKN